MDMKIGCSDAANAFCSQRVSRETMTMAGAATPAVVFSRPPTAPATGSAARFVTCGSSGVATVSDRAMSTSTPMPICSQEASSHSTSRAPSTAPGRAEATTIPARPQSTRLRTESMIVKPETVVTAFVRSTPATGPSSSERTGVTTRPTPVPESRCRAEPIRIAAAARTRALQERSLSILAPCHGP